VQPNYQNCPAATDYETLLQQTEDYILGRSETIPDWHGAHQDVYQRHISNLPDLIPVGEKWDVFEQRILNYLFHPSNYKITWNSGTWFHKHSHPAIPERETKKFRRDPEKWQRNSLDATAQLIKALRKAGLTDDDILHLGTDGYDDPHFKRYLEEKISSAKKP
jgi:hypothetical protein